MAMATIFLVMLLSFPAAFAAEFTVNWAQGTDYSSWAPPANSGSPKEGDTMVFNWVGGHTVDVVDKDGYENCDSSKATSSATSSGAKVTLKAGDNYFICGVAGHCTGGMKLQVNAAAATSGGGSTPTPAAGGSPTTPASGGSTPSPTTPSPSGNGVADSLSGVQFSLGLGLGALAALLA